MRCVWEGFYLRESPLEAQAHAWPECVKWKSCLLMISQQYGFFHRLVVALIIFVRVNSVARECWWTVCVGALLLRREQTMLASPKRRKDALL